MNNIAIQYDTHATTSDTTPRAPTKVALKRMANESEYRTEPRVRAAGFSAEHVLPLIRCHDAARCLVMPRAERDLDSAVRCERFAGRELARADAC